jgi:hypothetical protein
LVSGAAACGGGRGQHPDESLGACVALLSRGVGFGTRALKRRRKRRRERLLGVNGCKHFNAFLVS